MFFFTDMELEKCRVKWNIQLVSVLMRRLSIDKLRLIEKSAARLLTRTRKKPRISIQNLSGLVLKCLFVFFLKWLSQNSTIYPFINPSQPRRSSAAFCWKIQTVANISKKTSTLPFLTDLYVPKTVKRTIFISCVLTFSVKHLYESHFKSKVYHLSVCLLVGLLAGLHKNHRRDYLKT